jgi:hypothetical protein
VDDDASKPQDEPDHPGQPQHERTDAAGRAGDLARLSQEAEAATFGDDESGRSVVPGVFSGDLGPKGRVAGQLRALSRRERATYGEVPRGTVAPGGGLLLLLPMLVIALVIIGIVVLLGWLLG